MTRPGVTYRGDGRCTFDVWAPLLRNVNVRLEDPAARDLSMERDEWGHWRVETGDVAPGTRYRFVLNQEQSRPDPASQFQPDGVHGPSAVVDHAAFHWMDAGWEGVPLEDMILYELHVGTFTSEGTFEAVIPRLPELRDLGINTIEIMPVAQFPGSRNWGYDGVYPYAVQESYGGPDGLKTLVDAIHRQGMSAVLDVVYNHLGPEGNYLRDFGPYFTDVYQTPWGQAINLDQEHSHDVRAFFIENALYWLREYHFDGLRLDAIHAIYDRGAKHFLRELAERVAEFSRRWGQKRYLIAESDLNDVRVIKPRRSGGYGMDAQWSDDFHHSLHALLTGEKNGYYEDFGGIDQLAKAYKEGFVYSWSYSVHRKRFYGSSSRQRPGRQFVVCSQNHDQVGNRMLGERLGQLVDLEALKLGAGALLLSPYVPLLFMGQEYDEQAPFQYFVSHTDEGLVEAVRQGRASEFASFGWTQECPDPQSADTFMRSKLRWDLRQEGRHGIVLAFYKHLIELRTSIRPIASRRKLTVRTISEKNVLTWQFRQGRDHVQCLMNFSEKAQQFALRTAQADWRKVLDSAETRWSGPGARLPETIRDRQEISMPRRSIALYRLEESKPSEEWAAAAVQVSATEGLPDAGSDSDL